MSESESAFGGIVERLPAATQSSVVSDELGRILAMLRESCPPETLISFDFDGKLYVHIDVKKREDVLILQNMLPSLGLGLFHNLSLGDTPHHPFYHRITAQVDR